VKQDALVSVSFEWQSSRWQFNVEGVPDFLEQIIGLMDRARAGAGPAPSR
jgi:hypothetical protein